MKNRLRALALGVLLAATLPAVAQQKVIRFIPEADLRSIDPIWTTAYITRNHGYMVYDTLFATDAKFQIQPQMVDKYEVSGDRLTYTFTLRDGLKFHDGQPVRSADCIASIQRWARRDAIGQKLAELTESWTAVNDRTFRLKLKKPFSLTLDALGKPSSNVPFIMPERIAKTAAARAGDRSTARLASGRALRGRDRRADALRRRRSGGRVPVARAAARRERRVRVLRAAARALVPLVGLAAGRRRKADQMALFDKSADSKSAKKRTAVRAKPHARRK